MLCSKLRCSWSTDLDYGGIVNGNPLLMPVFNSHFNVMKKIPSSLLEMHACGVGIAETLTVENINAVLAVVVALPLPLPPSASRHAVVGGTLSVGA